MEFTINVALTASPALEALLDRLASLLNTTAAQPETAPPPPVVVQTPASNVIAAPAAPAPAAPSAPPAAAVPLAEAPGYTLEQLARAGAELASQGAEKLSAANSLLAQFGVQSLTQIPKEQYGAFATALRGLGARI